MKKWLLVGLLTIIKTVIGHGQGYMPPQFKYLNMPIVVDVLNDYGDETIGKFVYDRSAKKNILDAGTVLHQTKQTELADGSYETTFDLFIIKKAFVVKLTFDRPVNSVSYSLKESNETLSDSLNQQHTFYRISTLHPFSGKYGHIQIVIKSKAPVYTFFDRVCYIDGINRSNFIRDMSYRTIGKLIIDTASKVDYLDIENIFTQVKQSDGTFKTTFQFSVMLWPKPNLHLKPISKNITLKFNAPVNQILYECRTKLDTTGSRLLMPPAQVEENWSADKKWYLLQLNKMGNCSFELTVTSKTPVYTTISGVRAREIGLMTW